MHPTLQSDISCNYCYSQEIDIQRGLEQIECAITNFFSSVDVDVVAQRPAAIITRTNSVYALVASIIESVDSICRDSADTEYMITRITSYSL